MKEEAEERPDGTGGQKGMEERSERCGMVNETQKTYGRGLSTATRSAQLAVVRIRVG